MKNDMQFTGKNGEFQIRHMVEKTQLNFPVANEEGIKSSVTQTFGGDCKLDQNHFLLEPVSIENLHNNRSTRNVWCTINRKEHVSLTGVSAQAEYAHFLGKEDEVTFDAGFMWQETKRELKEQKIEAAVRIFAPLGVPAELMQVRVTNKSDMDMCVRVTSAIPIYGRSADNLRDHRHVTSLLHRIRTTGRGVICKPVLSFDERGHQKNHMIYFEMGSQGDGTKPESFFPTVESFIGETGTFLAPDALKNKGKGCPAGCTVDGKEAMGAMAFPEITLAAGAHVDYILLGGMTEDPKLAEQAAEMFCTTKQADAAFEQAKNYWNGLVNISFETGNPKEDSYLKWICFQPVLRRIYGCSFLPYHDYGRGGRGWRDLWQDCLSLLLMNPQNVGAMIEKNYGGVRIDGTNATIIGDGDGNFIADRNGIARVWMDHALWPLITTSLYINQTGDIEILKKQVPYFKDAQTMRGTEIDTLWNDAYGNKQRTEDGQVYTGSVLEHILIQQLAAFYDVGVHNIYRLRGADWNDALDMAAENGESVAFTCAYAGNLHTLASILRLMESAGETSIPLSEEIEILLNDQTDMFDSVSEKKKILTEYAKSCRHNLSGRKKNFSLSTLAANLIQKSNWLTDHIRSQEWIDGKDSEEGWYNSYYDNHGEAVEGFHHEQVRMMLTGQVFSIMGNVATDAQIRKIVKSADHYLYRKEIGGYRLNTDFQELKFDMGRMFGFAYGEKENGAVFSHMAVMYANALYQRGFAKEGWKALRSLSDTALDFDTSHIYPGIPEYFRSDGRGMYHYLTGAASWYLFTMITEVFGVRGVFGNLLVHPKLLAEQFDEAGTASVSVTFAGKQFHVTYRNTDRKDYGSYHIAAADCDKTAIEIVEDSHIMISREFINNLSSDLHEITVTLA